MARTCQFKILKTPLDRKRKLEEDYDSQSELENSPSKRKRHSLDFKLKVISELESSYYSELARKYKITRSCIQDWKKNEKKLSNILDSPKFCISKINGKRNSLTKFRLAGGGQKALDENVEDVLSAMITFVQNVNAVMEYLG